MDVSAAAWAATLAFLALVFAVDLVVAVRWPRRPSTREATTFVVFYIGLALAFGVLVGVVWGQQWAGQFYAGWITEYSLSIDNLFVYLVIMSRFRVPEQAQRAVLLVGIVITLALRAVFILAGAAVIQRFTWVFYLFGAFLLWTAYTLLDDDEGPEDFQDNFVIRTVRRVIPTTTTYDGVRLRTTVDGKRLFTPLLVVMVAIGTAGLVFAFDSIPAIFGLTQEAYLVFTANAFGLLGLMQLFFLLGGLLDRLVYLNRGLAVILAFIGVRLIFEALADNTLPFINGGEPVEWVPELPISVSLGFIVVVLAVTTVASLRHTRRAAPGG